MLKESAVYSSGRATPDGPREEKIVIGVYVDDTVHVYSDDAEFEELNAKLKAERAKARG